MGRIIGADNLTFARRLLRVAVADETARSRDLLLRDTRERRDASIEPIGFLDEELDKLSTSSIEQARFRASPAVAS